MFRYIQVKAAAALMEEGLEIMGVTAIEDKLQDGVSDALHTLQQAGIKVRTVVDNGDSDQARHRRKTCP